MSRKYKFHDPAGVYFISFATVDWIDVLTRPDYKDIIVESLKILPGQEGVAAVRMGDHDQPRAFFGCCP